nr:LptA/OstA family protein [Mariprofundus sp. NF]
MVSTPLWAGPVEIESDKMVFMHKTERAEFINRVHLKRDDFELYCDKLVAYYKDNQLDHAVATGHIRLSQKKITGRSDKAILDQKNNILTLIGNAVLEQPGGRIEGETITHNMNREETSVQPVKGGRTHMTIDADESEKPTLPIPGVTK